MQISLCSQNWIFPMMQHHGVCVPLLSLLMYHTRPEGWPDASISHFIYFSLPWLPLSLCPSIPPSLPSFLPPFSLLTSFLLFFLSFGKVSLHNSLVWPQTDSLSTLSSQTLWLQTHRLCLAKKKKKSHFLRTHYMPYAFLRSFECMTLLLHSHQYSHHRDEHIEA